MKETPFSLTSLNRWLCPVFLPHWYSGDPPNCQRVLDTAKCSPVLTELTSALRQKASKRVGDVRVRRFCGESSTGKERERPWEFPLALRMGGEGPFGSDMGRSLSGVKRPCCVKLGELPAS